MTQDLAYEALLARSQALGYRPPTEANRLEAFADRREEVEQHARGVRPVLHADVPPLVEDFLALKRAQGSDVERARYADMSVSGFVTRLLRRRPLAFFSPADTYLLESGREGSGGFESIGTARERPPLELAELLSYDEMAISALLGVSVPTHFVNAGGRHNAGRPGAPGSYEPRGVYMGLVGARLERPGVMECRHLLVTPTQNTAENGYGPEADPEAARTRSLRAWARLYGCEWLPACGDVADDPSRYLQVGHETWLDTLLYRRRLRVTLEVFLREADARGAEAGRPVYAHAVGLGLGVWRVHPQQTALMLEVYAELLRELSLPHLADLDFSWFSGVSACGGVGDGEVWRAGGNAVRLHVSRRDPAAALEGPHAGKLLVAMYAWDGNAYPGNEYWLGMLTASGDPAAACCSMIPELQHPVVNPRVSGAHLRVHG